MAFLRRSRGRIQFLICERVLKLTHEDLAHTWFLQQRSSFRIPKQGAAASVSRALRRVDAGKRNFGELLDFWFQCVGSRST